MTRRKNGRPCDNHIRCVPDFDLILADLQVARAELAKLAGDDKAMRDHCDKAIAICDELDCGHA